MSVILLVLALFGYFRNPVQQCLSWTEYLGLAGMRQRLPVLPVFETCLFVCLLLVIHCALSLAHHYKEYFDWFFLMAARLCSS